VTEDQLNLIEQGKFANHLQTIARLTAEVRRLRQYIQTYTAVVCRGKNCDHINYPEWAERALRD
jgi:hypothetical protein